MSVLDHEVPVRPWRPSTAVYPDCHQVAQSRNEDFPPTASGREQIIKINLEGTLLSLAALIEMIVPLARAIRTGAYGPTALVVIASDNGTLEFLEALAIRHDLAFFVSSSPNQPLTEARPVGALSPTDLETIALVRRDGGEVTSSRVATLAGIEPNAAVNRVSGLARKGYLHRVSRSRTEGDAFVDLLSATFEKTLRSLPQGGSVQSLPQEFSIPEDIREGVLAIAAMQGKEPVDVLVRAWHEFLSRHHELLNVESEEVGKMIREGDTSGLAKYAGHYDRERAKQAITRRKR